MIHREFIRLRVEKTAISAGLDNMVMGLVLFDQLGTPVYVNAAAESILARHPAISMVNHRILATDRDDNEKLHRFIRSCLLHSQHSMDERDGTSP